MNNHLEIVKLLVEKGADVFLRNEFNKMAIDEALNRGYDDISVYFIILRLIHLQ